RRGERVVGVRAALALRGVDPAEEAADLADLEGGVEAALRGRDAAPVAVAEDEVAALVARSEVVLEEHEGASRRLARLREVLLLELLPRLRDVVLRVGGEILARL